jgi:hypothetical protein
VAVALRKAIAELKFLTPMPSTASVIAELQLSLAKIKGA